MTTYTCNISIKGLDVLEAYVSSIELNLKDSIRDGINESLVEIKDIAKMILASRSRVGEPRDGAINDNWESNPQCTYYGNTVQGALHNYSTHWRAVEFGTADKASGRDEDFPSKVEMIEAKGQFPLVFQYQGHWYRKWEVHGQEPIAYARGALLWAKSSNLVKKHVIEQLRKNGLGALI